jgi:hypothetical protein
MKNKVFNLNIMISNIVHLVDPFSHMAPQWMRVTLNGIFYNTSSCKDPPVGSWLPSSVMSEVVCLKRCIYRCTVKYFGVWDAAHPFTLGLPPGITLNGVFYYTSFCTHPTVGSWLPRIVVGEVVCFKGCISRCAVKSSGVWEATHSFTSRLPPGVTLIGFFYHISFCMHRTVCSWMPRVMSRHRCIEFYMARTVMFIVDILSHNQIYGEDAILMGMKYATFLSCNNIIRMLLWKHHTSLP